MTIHIKHSSYQIKSDFFHSQDSLGFLTKNIVNTTGCTLDTCVPIGLQTIDATGRGNYIVPTNYEPPLCRKFIEIYRLKYVIMRTKITPITTLHEGSLCFPSVHMLFNNINPDLSNMV
jgi:hypothetical protein